MNDRDTDLDLRLRAWYRVEVSESEVAPAELRTSVATIPRTSASPVYRLLGARRRAVLLLAAALAGAALLGVSIAVGSGLVRLTAAPPLPLPSPASSPSSSTLNAGPLTPSPRQVLQPGWSSTGSMSVGRSGQTATLLANGTVLVAGGNNGDCCFSSTSFATSEIYDPATGGWRRTGSMSVARSWHTATLLPSGKVLVAGGTFDDRASAEIYDPETGTWSPAANMTEPRSFHTATLLPVGKVLVAGGTGPRGDANGFLATAELYDPATNTWTSTGNMTTIFGGFHRAALLFDGRVLLAGGYGIPGAQASADLYDPNTGTWSAARSMIEARWNFAATRLEDGRVLVAGGEGDQSGVALASAELFDPATGTWSLTGSMSRSRVALTATLLRDGRVLAAGGEAGNLDVVRTASRSELYDSRTGRWSDAGSPTQAGSGQTATLLPDGRVLVAGIVGPDGPTSSAELFIPPAVP